MIDGRPQRYESPPHLPPVSVAPILEHYDLDKKRLPDELLLEAPVDDRGVVDIFKTVELALSLVDDSYVWPRLEKQPDIHHFVWERNWYHPRHFGGSRIPRDYRDNIPFHKGYMPRQLHHFLHATIAPPEVPDFSVMEARVANYAIAADLFESARGVVTATRRPRKIAGVSVAEATGEITLSNEILMQIITNFNGYFENSRANVLPNNEFMVGIDVYNHHPEHIATELGRIAASNAVNLMPLIYQNKRSAKTAA